MVAIICGVIGLVVNTISRLCVKELPEEENPVAEEAKPQDDKIGFVESLKLLLSNKYYILIVAIYIVYYFMSNLTTGSAIYFMKHVLGNGSLLGLFSMMKMFPVIIALIFTPVLVKKTGSMQKVNFWGYVVSDILGVFLIVFAMQKSLPMMLLFMFLKGTFAGTMSGILNALIAEISGYTYRTKGVHIDGMMFSCSSLGVKVGGGIGTAAVGWLLDAAGYVGTAEAQTGGAVSMIFNMYITIPVILGVVITVLLGLMKVEKENKRIDMERAGFNAIRSAHHPMSRAMLDACDHIGMLVMDELTDMWNRSKNPYDFSGIFQEEADQWISHMVKKDYNHPSVVIYSVGNEIQEAGTKQGAWINRFLCNRFHELDYTRYTTNALNGLNCAGRRLGVIMRDVVEKFGMDTQGKGSGRYELEGELHPGKTVLGTETYPADIENLWDKVEKYPHVIGDFTWTGYDYIGEAGVGIFHYDGTANFTSIYPERLGYIGDIDLIGNRRPISYYREIVYGLTDQPYIAVERMEHIGQTAEKTAWMFKDNIDSWTWNGFEGTTASVDVYSAGDEVELFLNEQSLGRKPVGKEYHYTATYEVPYEPGKLKAVAYRGGEVIGVYELVTAQTVKKLDVRRVTEQERDVAYMKIWITDEQGIWNPQEKEARLLHAEVTGNGVLEGFGTANPSSEEDYFADTVTSFDGSALAVVRWRDPKSEEPAVLQLWTEDGCEATVIVEPQTAQ